MTGARLRRNVDSIHPPAPGNDALAQSSLPPEIARKRVIYSADPMVQITQSRNAERQRALLREREEPSTPVNPFLPTNAPSVQKLPTLPKDRKKLFTFIEDSAELLEVP